MIGALRSLLLAVFLAAASGPPGAAQTAPAATVFDEVQRLVAERFYDPHFGGRDWPAIAERHRPEVLAAADPAAREAAINRMLGELGASHTGFFTPADPAYYDLADIFSGALRRELPRHFPDGEVAYAGIGAVTRASGGKIFVSGLLAGFPAEQAGLMTGDEILTADGARFDPIGAFAGKAGKTVVLAVRSAADGPLRTIAVAPERIRPNEAYRKAIEASARIIERGGARIGYIRMWSYAGGQYQRTLERALAGPLKDADAVVWDLRDGWGGAQPEYLDVFNPRGTAMTMIDRDGDSATINNRWRKPVVLLINGGTRSGKEVLAYGFKKYGFGPLVGTRTLGAVLAARAFMLSDGSLLELPLDDVRVDGERLEGVGVAPDVEVPFALEYSAGADPQLERALAIAAHPPNG